MDAHQRNKQRYCYLCLVVLWGLMGWFKQATAVTVESLVNYYDVTGFDLEQVRQQIDAKAPRVGERSYPIQVALGFKWKPMMEPKGNVCKALPPTLDLSAQITMPRWLSQSRGTVEAQQAWIMFMSAAHQYLHEISAIIEQSGQSFVDKVAKLPTGSCQQLTAQVDKQGRIALARANKNVRDYQIKTKNGKTLGLVIP